MAVSEQELRTTIAQMREQLRSTAASRRLARVIGILGVVVGLCIVALIVGSVFAQFRKISANPEELRAAATEQIRNLQLERKASDVAKELMPVVQKEALALVKELDLPKVAADELKIMLRDLEPVARRELERVTPRLRDLVEAESARLQEDLRATLEGKLADRFSESIRRHEQRLETLDLTEEKLAQIIENLQMASAYALQDILEPRLKGVVEELKKAGTLILELPPLPEEKSEEQLLVEIRDVLVALLKERLPGYEIDPREIYEPVQPGTDRPAYGHRPPTGPPQEPQIPTAEEEAQLRAAAARSAAGGGQ